MMYIYTLAFLWTLCSASNSKETAFSGYNVALQGQASQSSDYLPSHNQGHLVAAKNAIDGNGNTNYKAGSCSHTGNDLSPWWRVDLLRPYKISYITITNRGDCCGERLTGAEILIGNSAANNGNNNARCAVVDSIGDGQVHHYPCHGRVGRYVNIILRGKRQYLHLCEVKVWTHDKKH